MPGDDGPFETLIRIDLKTMRRNPDAGRTVYHFLGAVRELSDGSQERDIRTVYSLVPESGWLYEYERTPITCRDCGEVVDARGLQYDSVEHVNEQGGFDYDDTNSACPKCGSWYCLESGWVVWETVAQALQRKAETEKAESDLAEAIRQRDAVLEEMAKKESAG